jgi:hypothetical protein
VRDGGELFPGPDVRFRFVSETDDYGQVIAWMDAEHARIVALQRSAVRPPCFVRCHE